MSGVTSRLALPVVQGTDKRINLPTTWAALTAILDATAITLEGTHSGRPAANTVAEGTYYYETDTGKDFRSDGTTWQPPVADASITSRQLKPSILFAKASAGVALSGTAADVTGTSQSITPAVASTLLAVASFDFNWSGGTGSGLGEGWLDLDGSAQTSTLTGTSGRNTGVQIYKIALTATSHTLKLRASVSATSGTGTMNAGSLTSWGGIVFAS